MPEIQTEAGRATMQARAYRAASAFVDEVTLLFTTLVQPARAFARTAEGPPPDPQRLLDEVASAPPRIHWPAPVLAGRLPAGSPRVRVAVDVPSVGSRTFLDILPASKASADTLLVYHHGLGEVLHDPVPMAFRRLFRSVRERCDLVMLKAPEHTSPDAIGRRFLACRSRFGRLLAGQVATAKAVADALGHGYRHLVMCGVSMGGIVTLGETSHEPRFDLGVPLLAGPRLHDVLLRSSLRRNVHAGFRRREAAAEWIGILDLEQRIAATPGPPIRPLLGRADRLFLVDAQAAGYRAIPRAKVAFCDGGHITGAVDVRRTGRHLIEAMREVCWQVSPEAAPARPDPGVSVPLAPRLENAAATAASMQRAAAASPSGG